MKKYTDGNQLRLVGKAWEIRYQLRKISGTGSRPNLLGDYLKGKTPST